MQEQKWALGVDIGGTKLAIGAVNNRGAVLHKIVYLTNIQGGPSAIEADIIFAAHELQKVMGCNPLGLGIGMAGQIDDKSGVILFAPNFGWHHIPLKSDLEISLGIPVAITADVRAATIGEWLYGAARGTDHFVCLFAGTGVGGGIVSEGRLMHGSSNTAGELGHMVVEMNGPACSCGGNGCVEAFAGGWAIAKRAQEHVTNNPDLGKELLILAKGAVSAISAKIVIDAFHAGNPLAIQIMDKAAQALIACGISIVNAINPKRLILGGGIIYGAPQLVDQIDKGIRKKALSAATTSLQVIPSQLQNNAGLIGAAALILHPF